MQLNKTTDYAIRIVLYLSEQKGVVTSEEISNATGVSQNYVMRILRKMTKAGILQVTRGVNGGFSMNKRDDEVSLYDIITEMEKTIQINQCLDDEENCNLKRTDVCPVRKYYVSLQDEFEKSLKETTIAKLKSNDN